ncbi:MAG: lmo0937 family membrane protein [Candidatus Aquicultor sp.]
MFTILWIIIAVLLVIWVVGLAFKLAGALIHILLVIALVLLAINLISGALGRRR